MSDVEAAALAALGRHPPRLIALGGSAGGLDALSSLLGPLPSSMPPLAVVLHLPADAPTQLASILTGRSRLTGSVVCDKDAWRPGTVHVAPPGYHLLVERHGSFALSLDDPTAFSRPSIDVLFETAAWALGADLLAIVLSGASADGAAGAAEVRAHGGSVWVQEPSTASFTTMPTAACPVADVVLPPARMGAVLAAWVGGARS